MITTLKAFCIATEQLQDIADAASLFEDHTTEEVRALMYSMAPQGSAEPFRAAMHIIGYVQY